MNPAGWSGVGRCPDAARVSGRDALALPPGVRRNGGQKVAHTPKITVIIVNYNSGNRLERCLKCLEVSTEPDFEVIVVDNASSDGSHEAASEYGKEIDLIVLEKNTGFAAANNFAAKRARGEWLAFLNPDAYAEPAWLSELMNAAERYPRADAFGSTQLIAADPGRLDGAGDAYHVFGIPYRGHHGLPATPAPDDEECFAPCAAAAMYRRSVFLALGGFAEHFFVIAKMWISGFACASPADGRCRPPGRVCATKGPAFPGVKPILRFTMGTGTGFGRFSAICRLCFLPRRWFFILAPISISWRDLRSRGKGAFICAPWAPTLPDCPRRCASTPLFNANGGVHCLTLPGY